MIAKDFKLDFDKKKIYYNSKGSGRVYSVNELYSYLQDVFDEPENMSYQMPISAKSKTKYFLINGWTIDKESLKFVKGKINNSPPPDLL